MTAIYTYPFTRSGPLSMGAIVALLVRDPAGTQWLRRFAPKALAVALPAALLLVVRSDAPAWTVWGPVGQVVGYPVVAFTFATALAWSVTTERPFLNAALANPMLQVVGRYSYAMYVIHLPLDTSARLLGLHVSDAAQQVGGVTPVLVAYSILAGVATLVLAMISWNLLEKHFLALKGRFRPVFPDRRLQPAAAGAIGRN
jgi:peptidoglycan/LPS O-acetylase OafA/YrhL